MNKCLKLTKILLKTGGTSLFSPSKTKKKRILVGRAALLLLLAAGTTAACAQFSITAAYSKAAASEISVYDYTQVIFTAFLSLAVLREIPDYLSVIGYLIIIGAAFWKWKKSQASA